MCFRLGTIQFQYLKTVVAIQDCPLSESRSEFMISRWIVPIWEGGVRSKQKSLRLFFATWNLRFRFLLRSKNHDMEPQSKWSLIKSWNVIYNHFHKYFETLWCFTKFSFDHKRNDARLLLINMVYKSCLTSCQTT